MRVEALDCGTPCGLEANAGPAERRRVCRGAPPSGLPGASMTSPWHAGRSTASHQHMAAVRCWQEMLDEWALYAEDSSGYMTRQVDLLPEIPSAHERGQASLNSRRRCTLYEVPAGSLMCLQGDVLVGYRNGGYVDRRVETCVGSAAATCVVPACACELAWHSNGVPLAALQHTEVVIRRPPAPPFYLVFAVMPRGVWRQIRRGAWGLGPIFIRNGRTSDRPPSVHWEQLPGGVAYWRMRAEWKKRQQDVYLRELLAVACHPSRLRQIVSTEELEELG